MLRLRVIISFFLILFLMFCGGKKDGKKEGESVDEHEKKELKSIYLLYPSDDNKLHRYEIKIEVENDFLIEVKKVLEAYLGTKPQSPLDNPFPEGSSINSIFILDDKSVVIDLNSKCATPCGSDEEIFRIYGIINTLNLNYNEIKKVKILIDGYEREVFAGHIDISNFLPPEKSLNGD